MNKTWLVMKQEITANVGRRSWLVITFGVPLIAALILLGTGRLRGGAPTAQPVAPASSPALAKVEGYVDHSGLIQELPPDVEGRLTAFSSEASARQALSEGAISAYYVVPNDFVKSGDLIYVDPDFVAFSPEGESWAMRWALRYNVLGGNLTLAHQVANPMDVEVTALAPPVERLEAGGSQYWIAYGTGMVLYIAILFSGSLLRNSMGNEKKNRVMEILMASVSPQQLLAGKMIGLAIVGVLQTVIWAGTGYTVLRVGGQSVSLPGGGLPFSLVVWAAVFFLLGFAVYASLLAGLGALAGPNEMGSSSADVIVIWPLIIPMFFISILIQYPQGSLATVLGLFPLTAPISMMIRLAVGGIPLWQPVLAAALMGLTAFFVMRAVARVFRAQMLLSGQPFTAKRYFAVLLGKAE